MGTSFSGDNSHYPDSKNPNSIRDGLQYQDEMIRVYAVHGIIVQQFVSSYGQLTWGESYGGHEIKLDRLCTDTGRLSFEIAEKSRASMLEWTPSGIYAATNPLFYGQGNRVVHWLFATKDLVAVHRAYVKRRGKGSYEWDETPTIRKFYLPLPDADRLCIKKFIIRPDGQYNLFESNRR